MNISETPDTTSIPENEEKTLKYSEQLTEMVKANHHQLQLEKQLMEAKKHFQKKSKSELIDLILSMTNKLDKSKKKYYKNNSKPDLIAILVKNWMLNKKELDKKVDDAVLAMPEEVKTSVMEMAKVLIETENEKESK